LLYGSIWALGYLSIGTYLVLRAVFVGVAVIGLATLRSLLLMFELLKAENHQRLR